MKTRRTASANEKTSAGKSLVSRRSLVSGLLLLPASPILAATGNRANILATKIGPVTSIDEYAAALRFTSTRNNAALVDVGADWCEFCEVIIDRILPDEKVAALMARLALIRIDVTSMSPSNKALMQHLKVDGPPTVYVVNTATGKEFSNTRSVGSFSVDDLAARLRPFVR